MTKEGLELLPGDGDCTFSLMLLLVLLSMEVDAVPKEKCCKRDTVGVLGSGGGKVIFTLLAKVIVLHMGLITIDVR